MILPIHPTFGQSAVTNWSRSHNTPQRLRNGRASLDAGRTLDYLNVLYGSFTVSNHSFIITNDSLSISNDRSSVSKDDLIVGKDSLSRRDDRLNGSNNDSSGCNDRSFRINISNEA